GPAATGAAIDLNTATAAQLEELPKVGPVLAQRIVEHREQIGGFRSVEELDDVSGIGPAMMEAIAPLVTV
ncbi:MAG: helix-hairpin-helix domain-containing protein, partial [Micrococcales bacterium]|nr:helix-hairpin-helix domain-containing protein [Micrococcales bacterium]